MKAQCSLNSREVQYEFGSSMSIKGLAYFDKLAVNITTSKCSAIDSKNSIVPGLTAT